MVRCAWRSTRGASRRELARWPQREPAERVGAGPAARTDLARRYALAVRTPIRIDAMREADVRAVARIESAGESAPPHREDDLRSELERPWSHAWVARDEHGGDAIAFVIAWHVVDEIHVLSLATRPDRRRAGVGRLLMQEVLALARGKHAARVLLEVRRSNAPALALYRSIGFFASGVRARYYADDEDAIEMTLAFDRATGDVVRSPDEVQVGDS
jgi:ribosomal-protein-alanine N-acetyltransferase